MPIPKVGRYDVRRFVGDGLYVATRARHEATPFRSSSFVFAIRTEEAHVKVFKIHFQKQEPGVFLVMPYFDPPHAILGRYVITSPPGQESLMELREGGKITQKGVKLTHHKSGAARFSLTDHIQPDIRNRSTPLESVRGHLFSVYAKGPGRFAAMGKRDRATPNAQRTTLTFKLEQRGQVILKVIGQWFPRGMMPVLSPGPQLGDGPNPVHMQFPDGRVLDGYVVAPPAGWPWGGYVLALAAEPFPFPDTGRPPYLLVTGGFGTTSGTEGGEGGTSLLAAMYTDRTAELSELTDALGSVDIPAPARTKAA